MKIDMSHKVRGQTITSNYVFPLDGAQKAIEVITRELKHPKDDLKITIKGE